MFPFETCHIYIVTMAPVSFTGSNDPMAFSSFGIVHTYFGRFSLSINDFFKHIPAYFLYENEILVLKFK